MKIRVTEKFISNYPNPIEFQVGERLGLGAIDDEYPDWIRVITKTGNEGWAPIEYIEQWPDRKEGMAKENYSAAELDVLPGQILSVFNEIGGWYLCEDEKNVLGWVPKKHTAKV